MNRSYMSLRAFAAGLLSLAVSFASSAVTEPAGPMAQGRQAFGAVPLADGRALVVGGFGNPGLMYGAEIYDPVGTTFSSTGSLITPRGSLAAAPLQDGRVLVMGGAGPGDATSGTLPLKSAEIFDPATGTWSETGSMSVARWKPVALTLPDGRVLVMGGQTSVLLCEIFDPATGLFSETGSFNVGREAFAAAVLQDGRVLVVGGVAPVFGTNLAEVWDPLTGLWNAVGPMAHQRVSATATTLQDGTVLVTGGQTYYSSNVFIAPAEVFDPVTGNFTATGGLNVARSEHVAARLADGRVVIAGGTATSQYAVAGVEIYDPSTGAWSVVGTMADPRQRHSGALLADGSLLVAGGFNTVSSSLASAEIIDPACMASEPSISLASASFPSVASSGSVSVTHVAGCQWRATGAPAWITITNGALGSGSDTVAYSVAENTGTARSAALNIASKTHTVNQAAGPCAIPTLSPTGFVGFAPAGGTTTTNLSIGAGCVWTVSGAPAWITITSGGTGPGPITYTAAQNLGAARSSTFTIAGASFFVSQVAGPCVPSPTLSPTARFVGAAGGNSTVAVTAPAACPWTVTDMPSWITMFTSGTGNATLSFTFEANPNATSRTAFFTVAGKPFSVQQDANLCGGATINPSNLSLQNTSGSGTIALTAPANCAWTITAPSEVNFPSGYSGTGSATLTYQVNANNGAAWTRTVTIAGATLTVTQAAGACYPGPTTITPTSAPPFGSSGGTFTVNVTAQPGCSWTAWNFPAWITITTPLPQSGSGTFTYVVAPNTGAARSATPVIAGSTHSVTQAPGACFGATISPTSSPVFGYAGGSLTVNVTAQAGCTWTVANLPAWVTVTSPLPVTGSGSVTYSVAPNSSNGAARSATLVIAGANHSVNQSVGACVGTTISPTSSPTIAGEGGSVTVNVTTQAGCTWTATGMPAWITVTSPLPVAGSGSVTYSAASNSGFARNVTLVVAGVNHSVSQAAGSCNGTTISPTSPPPFTAAGGSFTVNVTAPPTCTWSPSVLPWITVTSPVPGTGNGIVTYVVAPNTGAARSATILIAANQWHTVSQAAEPCLGSTVVPLNGPSFTTAGGSFTFNVTTQPSCTWSVSGVPAWVTVTSALPVTGSGSVSYSVAANGGATRSATLVSAGGASHSVSQAGSGTPPPTSYCASKGGTGFEWIAQTTIAGVVRTSGSNNGYADFTASPPIALARGSNVLTLTAGGGYSEVWRVWIDFNNDMAFTGDELVFSGSANSITSSFIVPSTVPAGTKRMRVSMSYGGAPPVCGNFTYGEVEDYSVAIP